MPASGPEAAARPEHGRTAHRTRLGTLRGRPEPAADPGRGGADRGRLGTTDDVRAGPGALDLARRCPRGGFGPRGGSGPCGGGGGRGNDRRPLRRAPGLERVVKEPGMQAQPPRCSTSSPTPSGRSPRPASKVPRGVRPRPRRRPTSPASGPTASRASLPTASSSRS